MNPTQDQSVKVTSLIDAAIALLDEPAHIDRGTRSADQWNGVYLTADRDGASVPLTVRSPFKAKGLWIIEVGQYSDALSLRKRDLDAIKAIDLAILFKDQLRETRHRIRANQSVNTWQVVADRINAVSPRCGIRALATADGIVLSMPNKIRATEVQATTLMIQATVIGLGT